MATQVTMEDGTEGPLEDHLRDAHQKGTRGYTEEYLDGMHRNLHERKREPEEELEHRHPGVPGESKHTPESTNTKHRDREEQEKSEAMKAKNRDRDGQRNAQDSNGKHRDRYAQPTPEVPGQRNQQSQGTPSDMNRGDMNRSDMNDGDMNGRDMNGSQRDREDQMASAGAGQQKNGKHRKQRH